MVKKILFIFVFLITLSGFSQEKSIDRLVASPNPFINNTTIYFNVKKEQTIILTVRNVLGKTVFSEKIASIKGRNSFLFERQNLESGMYIYTIQSKSEIISKRFILK